MTISASLDEDQHAAVHAGVGPLLIVAGAGAGKTRVLVHRAAHLIRAGISAERILLLTFTQRAARSMSRRLTAAVPSGHRLCAGTFHGIAARLLRDYAELFGYTSSFSILDRWESRQAFSDAFQSTGDAGLSSRDIDRVYRAYSLALNTGQSISDVIKKNRGLVHLNLSDVESRLTDYVVSKLERNAMDYDDLLLYWQLLLRSATPAAHALKDQFDAVLVDEYQDLNSLQVDIVRNMVSQHSNLTAVGDDFQAIYGFRGADLSAMLTFQRDFDDAQVQPLRYNYRSTPEVVHVAMCSIAHNAEQLPKTMIATRPSRERPKYCSFDTSDEESTWVAERIKALHHAGVPYNEQVVLYRTHAQSVAIELALHSMGIPFVKKSGRHFLEKPYIQQLVFVLRVMCSPTDWSSWSNVFKNFHGVGPAAADGLVKALQKHENPWSLFGTPNGFATVAVRFKHVVESITETLAGVYARRDLGLCRQLEYLIDSPYFASTLRRSKDQPSMVDDLTHLLKQSSIISNPLNFLDGLALGDADDQVEGKDTPHVTLSTVHQSKGLEWEAVFLIGLYDGGFPLWTGFADEASMDEERRLFFVGLTRAKRFLYLSHPWSDDRGRQAGTLPVSRFIDEVLSQSPKGLEAWSNEFHI